MSQPTPQPQPQPTTPWPNPVQVPPRGPQTAPVFPAQVLAAVEPAPERALFALGDDPDFPRATDPALVGYVEVTAESCGLADDPIARILDLRRQLAAEVEALPAEQYRELVQYGWPANPGLRAVA